MIIERYNIRLFKLSSGMVYLSNGKMWFEIHAFFTSKKTRKNTILPKYLLQDLALNRYMPVEVCVR